MPDPLPTSPDGLGILAPLAELIHGVVRSHPVASDGGDGGEELAAAVTARTVAWLHEHVLPHTPGLAGFTADVDAERLRQLARWGDQRHPDGTGPQFTARANEARTACESAFSSGQGTWRHILHEEIQEAFAESDPAALRAELLQSAAVIQAWTHDLDHR